jgi:hypothetical protein
LRLRPNLTSTVRSYPLEDADRRCRTDQHDERHDGEEVDDDHLACFASAERTGRAAVAPSAASATTQATVAAPKRARFSQVLSLGGPR